MSGSGVEEFTGVLALGGIGICTIALVTLHLLPTGLSPVTNPVSQYGITPYCLGYRIQTIAMGIAAISIAIGLTKLGIAGTTTVVVLLVLGGIARLLISWFPMDKPSSERTETGRRHGLLALVAFGGISIAAFRLGGILSQANDWHGVSSAITVLGVVMVLSLLAMGVVRRNNSTRHYFGLAERGFYLAAIVFFAVVGSELLRLH